MKTKNFELGMEWIWTKEKFLNRKIDMSEYFLDIKDGTLDSKKFLVIIKNFSKNL